MTVQASSTVAVSSTPSSDQVWALAYMLSANWRKEVVVRSAHSTSISSMVSTQEQRGGLTGRPARIVDVQISAMNRRQLSDLRNLLNRASSARWLFPLFSDETVLTAVTTALTTTISCDTTYRRFCVGARVVVFDETSGNFATGVIQSLSSSSITLTAAIGVVLPKGASVMPLIESRLNLKGKMTVQSDTVAECQVQAMEVPGPWCLDSSSTPGVTPSGISEFQSIPIFPFAPNYDEPIVVATLRAGSYTNSGISDEADVFGTRASNTFEFTKSCSSRAEFWEVLKFFDSRCGCTFPFWCASPIDTYEMTGVTVSGVSVVAEGLESDWSFRPHVAAISTSGEVEIRQIASVTRSGSEDLLNLTTPFSFPEDEISRVCAAVKCRFSSDELAESWMNLKDCNIAIAVTELPVEQDITLAHVKDDETLGLAARFAVTNCNCSVTFPCLQISDLTAFGDCIAPLDSNVQTFLANLYFGDPVTASCEWIRHVFGFDICGCAAGGSWTDGYGNTYSWSYTGEVCGSCGDDRPEDDCCYEISIIKT